MAADCPLLAPMLGQLDENLAAIGAELPAGAVMIADAGQAAPQRRAGSHPKRMRAPGSPIGSPGRLLGRPQAPPAARRAQADRHPQRAPAPRGPRTLLTAAGALATHT